MLSTKRERKEPREPRQRLPHPGELTVAQAKVLSVLAEGGHLTLAFGTRMFDVIGLDEGGGWTRAFGIRRESWSVLRERGLIKPEPGSHPPITDPIWTQAPTPPERLPWDITNKGVAALIQSTMPAARRWRTMRTRLLKEDGRQRFGQLWLAVWRVLADTADFYGIDPTLQPAEMYLAQITVELCATIQGRVTDEALPLRRAIEELAGRLRGITDIIERVDNRAAAADGPVGNTRETMMDDQMCQIYELAKGDDA